MIALFNLGGGEIAVIVCLMIVLFGASRLPKLARGLGESIREFRKTTRELADEPLLSDNEKDKKTGG